MKLLTWMHRKIRQNNNDIFKEFPHGGPSRVNNQPLYYPKQNQGSSVGGRESYRRGSFGSLESDEGDRESWVESFDGFLAIGTLGSETYVSEPETPTFVISVDNIAERETEATQSELNLINEELEKVLAAAEAKEADESGRSSNGRRSSTSTMESGDKTATCPLQGFLFRSAVEMAPERKSSVGKKNRASLGELFQRHKAEESSGGLKSDRGEKQVHKDGDKTSTNLMRKILRKKSSAEHPDYAASETKFHKMLHLFHKKVHPETSMDILNMNAHNKSSIKDGDFRVDERDNCYGGDDGFVTVSDDTFQLRNQFPTQITSAGFDSIENRELWIKTDADYLVLEL